MQLDFIVVFTSVLGLIISSKISVIRTARILR